jgi:hypothetical protein
MPENSYNMDKKGFMIGIIRHAKRKLSGHQWEKKRGDSSTPG